MRANTLLDLSWARGIDQGVRNAAVASFAALDGRPKQMLSAGRIAMSITSDPLRRDLYMRTAFQRSPSVADEGIRAWYYYLSGDVAALRLLATQANARRADRAMATDYLGKLGDDAFAGRNFESLLGESYEDVYPIYAGWLNRRHEWAAKERVVRRWLASHAGQNAIEDAYYTSSLADALEHQGRYDEAWKIVEPLIDVGSANIIETAASLLQRRGQIERANALGHAMIERYPGAWSRSGFAAILWREKRWQEAAALFDPKMARYSRSEWTQHVPEDFADTFEKSDAAAVSSAMDTLLNAGVDSSLLMAIPDVLRKHGRADLAFVAAERSCLHNPLTQIGPEAATEHVTAYTMLAAAKGNGAAIEWLRSWTPDAAVLQLVVQMYQMRQYAALFAVASPRPVAQKNIELQVYLAAALKQLRAAPDDPRVVALRGEVAAQTIDPNSLQGVTRYLLDISDENAFIAWGKSPIGRYSVEYFIGLKSASAGDYDRALRAILAATYATYGSPPQAWADGMLRTWGDQHGTWPEVARRTANE
jgi:tetratricopeptide (TPR) repeat protein